MLCLVCVCWSISLQASSYSMSELDGVICFTEMDDGGGLLRQWEGWQTRYTLCSCGQSLFIVMWISVYRCCYLSEAPCFADSALLALNRLTRLHCDGVMGPSPPTPGRLVHQLIWEMDHLPLQLNQPPAVSKPKIYDDVLCHIYSKFSTSNSIDESCRSASVVQIASKN